jgi:hypothetical protein
MDADASPDDAARRAFLTQIEMLLSLSAIAWTSFACIPLITPHAKSTEVHAIIASTPIFLYTSLLYSYGALRYTRAHDD